MNLNMFRHLNNNLILNRVTINRAIVFGVIKG